MKPVYIIGATVAVLVIIGLFVAIRRRRPKKLKHDRFTERWKALQRLCVSRKTWPQAIIEADNLLDEALKKAHFKGKTTGERLVSAQHTLTSNDTVWFGHKLRKTIASEDVRKLKKNDALEAPPNTLVNHIDFGLPGALPVLNEAAVALAGRAAFALRSQPQKFSKFDRKHYFYPDLPMGYQITQFDEPIILGGEVTIEVDGQPKTCLLYTSDAADDLLCVDLGGRR